jgi:hypothetical protein
MADLSVSNNNGVQHMKVEELGNTIKRSVLLNRTNNNTYMMTNNVLQAQILEKKIVAGNKKFLLLLNTIVNETISQATEKLKFTITNNNIMDKYRNTLTAGFLKIKSCFNIYIYIKKIEKIEHFNI